MSLVNVNSIIFECDQALFQYPIQMQITFEVLKPLEDDLEWKLIYVGSPNDANYDQQLDLFTMPPLQAGCMSFIINSNAPDPLKIPTKDDLFGASALILTAKYRQQEFFRVGYYVYNTYIEPELLENEPAQIQLHRLYRQINTQAPRITRFNIDWESKQQPVSYFPQQTSNQQFMFSQPVFQDVTNTTGYTHEAADPKFMQNIF